MATFYQPHISEGAYFLNEEESRHCVKVLRMRSNDSITVVDGKGGYYNSVIQETNSKRCTFNVLSQYSQPELSYSIQLLIAPTKNLDRTEWMVEKLTEIGIDSIQFVECDYSERRVLKLERLYRKAISAMKQSGRALLPTLLEMIPLSSWKDSNSENTEKFIAHIDETRRQSLSQSVTPRRRYTVLIGPEGGFSTNEVGWAEENGFREASLGHYRLRTETAGLAACQILHTIN